MIWISVKLYLIKKESAMKNQLKKIIHCVLITLILQSQVLSVQAAQVKFDENKKFSAVWRDNVAPTVSKSFTTAGTNMGVIGNFNPDTGRFDEYWQTCDVVVNFTAEDNVGITGYYLGKTNPLVSQVTWSDVAPSKTMATQKRIGLNGENPLYSADPSGTYYFAVRDAAGNIGVSTVEAQFTWVRGAANYSTGWKSIPNTNGYTYFAISYNHTSNCMYANYGSTTLSAPNAGVCDLVVNGGNANVRWDSILDVQTSYYYVYLK